MITNPDASTDTPQISKGCDWLRMEVRLQRGRVHQRLQRQGDPLPLPRWQHPDPVDPGTAAAPRS